MKYQKSDKISIIELSNKEKKNILKNRKRNLKKTMYLVLFLSFVISGLSVSQITNVKAQTETDSKIKVVCSTALIEDFVKNIGGDLVDLTSILVEGNEDPHTYEPTPGEISALISADVFFLMGRQDLEPWWDGEAGYNNTILEDNPDLHVVKIMNDSMIVYDPLIGADNPHGWMSPINAIMMVTNIYLELKTWTSGEQTTQLTEQYLKYVGILNELLVEIQGNATIYNGTKVVMHHPAMKYLYDLLGIDRIAVIEEKHDEEPSAQHIQEIKDKMIEEDCHLIVHQSNLDSSQVDQLAHDTNSKIIYSAPLIGMKGINGEVLDTYVKLIRYNIEALSEPQDPSDESTNSINGYNTFIFLGVGIVSIAIINRLIKKNIINS